MAIFDIHEFDKYKEDNRREVKKAKENIPVNMWDTYSAFANCYGGVIILGVKERDDGTWYTTGLKNPRKQRKQFWDAINDKKKVSINLLKETDVETYEVDGDTIMVIHVPMAKREEKPVYINDDLFGGTYRRNWEGDYRCTSLQVKAMLRDQTEETYDMTVLDKVSIKDLNYDTIHSYRNRHQLLKQGHPFEGYSDEEYLRCIGAAAISDEDGKLHPTAAGLLMFGNEFDIVRQFPDYFLDYREELDPSIRWTDRFVSSSGDWSGNLCDFYFRVYNKLQKYIKVPFKMSGGDRIDDTPVHKALREAIANCLINADFFGKFGIIIKKEEDIITLENPGYIRLGKHQMLRGGLSDPRNKAIMKMFNMINIGERAGSGVPNIFQTWDAAEWVSPVVEEQFNPDRTILRLSFVSMSDNGIETTQAPTQAPTQALTQAPTQAYGTGYKNEVVQSVYSLQELDLRIVNAMKTNPYISQSRLSEDLNVNLNTLKYHVQKLKRDNVIGREGSSQKGRWIINI